MIALLAAAAMVAATPTWPPRPARKPAASPALEVGHLRLALDAVDRTRRRLADEDGVGRELSTRWIGELLDVAVSELGLAQLGTLDSDEHKRVQALADRSVALRQLLRQQRQALDPALIRLHWDIRHAIDGVQKHLDDRLVDPAPTNRP